MNEQRVDSLPPSFMQDSKLLLKVIDKLCNDLADEQRQGQFTKKSMTMYLNTFAFETGFNPPNQQQLNTIYYYLEDPKKPYITKQKFQGFLKKCISLYIQSKKQPIGGIIDRLLLMLRNEALKEKQKQMQARH